MKKRRLLLLAITSAAVCALAAACAGHVHTYGSWTITKAPTDTESGIATRSCVDGDGTEELTLPVLTDTQFWTYGITTEATHASEGAAAYTNAQYELTVEVVLPAEGHTFEGADWVIVEEPTASAVGSAVQYCTANDGGTGTPVELPVLTNTEFWEYTEITPATHGVAGKAEYTNETYGLTIDVNIPAQAHTFDGQKWTMETEPTLTETGTAYRACTANDGGRDELTLPVLSDTAFWAYAVTTPATHTSEGAATYTNAEYGFTVDVKIPADENAHTWAANWTIDKDPTLTETGLAHRECTADDGGRDELTLPAFSDTAFWDEVETISDATHTETGERLYGNSSYGFQIYYTIPKVAHTFGAWEIGTAPTMEAGGKAVRYCTASECADNEESKEEMDLPALSDTTFWTAGSPVEADYNHAGYTPYSNAEYNIEYRHVTAPKLPAPYDGKTYYAVVFDATGDTGVVGMETSWLTANITLDANGAGTGTAYPFNYNFQFSISDYEAGILSVVRDDTTLTGYMDAATGILVLPRQSSWRDVVVWVPASSLASEDAVASAWQVDLIHNALAITYAPAGGDTEMSILIYDDTVYFNVVFADIEGTEIAADACYNAPSLYISQGDKVLFTFGYNGEQVVTLDGLQGSYSGSLGDAQTALVVSGFGTVTAGEQSGTYTIVSDGVIGATIGGVYYEITLNAEENTYEAGQPTVTITFDAGDYATVPTDTDAAVGMTYELPVPENETMLFRGWFYDEDCTKAVETPFIPTESTTLYAKWVVKVTLNLYFSDDNGEDPVIAVAGAGDTLAEVMADYSDRLEPTDTHYFNGWYLSPEFSGGSMDENVPLPDTPTEFTLYAKWEVTPIYVGSYAGRNTYSSTSVTSSKTVTIDVYGNITGTVTGTVTSFDEETGLITYTNSSGTTNYMWYSNGVLVFADSSSSRANQTIPSDIDTVVRADEPDSGNVLYNAQIAYVTGGATSGSTRVVTYLAEDGEQAHVLVYNNRIYAGVIVTDAFGDPLTAQNLRNSKTVIVRTAEGAAPILAVGSSLATIGTYGATISPLDNFYGVYTSGDTEIRLDGIGGVEYEGKTGSYTAAAEGAGYGFDVYLADGTEYYRLTLSGSTFTIEKPAATLILSSDYSSHEQVTLNVNIAYTQLPEPEADGYVFRGWFTSEDFSGEAVTSVTADTVGETITLYAKWLEEVTLTTDFNYDGAPEAEVYNGIGAGETYEVTPPTQSGYRFLGWFTSASDGDEWISGETPLTQSVTVYAHWAVAEPYYHTYDVFDYTGNDEFGTATAHHVAYSYGNTYFQIDADGNQSGHGISPFQYGAKIIDYVRNDEEGYATFKFQTYNYSGEESSTYPAYMQLSTGVIVMSYRPTGGVAAGPEWSAVILLIPFETSAPSSSQPGSSYWANGMVRTISFTDEAGAEHSVFVKNGVVYFDVAFKDAAEGGSTVAAGSCYETQTLYILQGETVLTSYGYNGTTMIEHDGLDGTYTATEGEALVLDGYGKFTLGNKSGLYTVVEEGVLDAYVIVDGARTEHYTLTLSGSAYTLAVNTVNSEIGQNPNSSSTEFGFAYDAENGYYSSLNKDVNNGNARMYITAFMAGTVTFEYQVSTENSDRLYIVIGDGTTTTGYKLRVSGNPNNLSAGASPAENGWVSYSVVLEQGESLWFIYDKDGSVNTGADTVWIRNLAYEAFDMTIAGTYTCTNEANITLDGRGGITRGDEQGVYERNEDGTLDVYFRNSDGENISHYTITLAQGMTYTAQAVTTTITFEMNGHGTAPAGITAYTNCVIALPASAEAEGFVFRGWFATEAMDGDAITSIEVGESPVTVYAKWDAAVTLTIDYAQASLVNPDPISVAVNDVITLSDYAPDTIYIDGKLFTGWTYTDGEAITDDTITIAEATSLTAVWEDHAPYSVALEPAGTPPVSATNDDYGFSFSEQDGYYQSTNLDVDSSVASMTITAYTSGMVSLEWWISSESATYDYIRIYLNSSDTRVTGGGTSDTSWHEFSCEMEAGDVLWIMYRKDGSNYSGADCVRVRNISFTAFDMSVAGDYNCTEGTVHLDGRGTITFTPTDGDVMSGDYTETSENTYDVFFEENGVYIAHYTLVIDVDDTCTLTPVTATISFEMGEHGTAPVIGTVYQGIATELPVPAAVEGYLFLGWSLEANSTDYITSITPASDEVAVYANWTEAHTLTIVYGAHGDVAQRSETFQIAAGTEIDLADYEPAYDNGYSFGAWYAGDTQSGTALESTAITMDGNKTFYASYVEGAPFVVELVGPSASDATFILQDDGSYKTQVGSSPTNSYIAIHVYATGTLTFMYRTVDEGDGTGSSYCVLNYDRYNAENERVNYYTQITWALCVGDALESVSWNTASIAVTEGDTVYIRYNKVDAGSNAAAAVKDFNVT